MNFSKSPFGIACLMMILVAMQSCNNNYDYDLVGDLFQPKFILEEPLVEGNSVSLVWYEINEAKSYTVEFYTDNYYSKLFEQYHTTKASFTADDIPYSTQYYIWVRANSDNPKHHSQWTKTKAKTSERPPFAKILNEVERVDIGENEVRISWVIDLNNPIDSITLIPAQDTSALSMCRYLTEEELVKGEAHLTYLQKNTLYYANVYDNTKSRKYDKPYNQIKFRTAGPSAETIVVNRTMNLDSLLKANNENAEIPEGAEYFLETGCSFKIGSIAIKKGFKLTGSTEGTVPQIELDGSWDIADGAYISNVTFENIRFYQTIDAGYFFNSGNSWTIDEVVIYNCVFNYFKRGFWRHKSGGKYKEIGSFEMSYSMLDEVGGHSGPYGTFSINSGGDDNIKKAVFSHCTFMRDHYQTDDKTKNFRHLFDYNNSAYPIHLEYRNVTICDYAYNQGLINIPAAENSTLIVENVLVAANTGVMLRGVTASTTKIFSNNYATSDHLIGVGDINGTSLSMSAEDLFVDPVAGNLTIKNPSSEIITNKVGDSRWWTE